MGARAAGGVARRALDRSALRLPVDGATCPLPASTGGDPGRAAVTRPVTGRATILHVDMDAFFVSVELLRRPELRGQPVVVGGTGDRGVVAAASYEARAYGVHSAMPCVAGPAAVPRTPSSCPATTRHYGEVSGRVMAIFRVVHAAGRAARARRGVPRRHRRPPAPRRRRRPSARAIRAEVLAEEGLTCSVGVAATKFLAKLASEAAKPRRRRPGPRPAPGVRWSRRATSSRSSTRCRCGRCGASGRPRSARLERLGVRTVGDLADLPDADARRRARRGQRPPPPPPGPRHRRRPVVPDQRPKSIGHEETFARRPPRPADARARGGAHGRRASPAGCAGAGLAGRTVTLKVRFDDFRTITRSTTLPAPVDDGPADRRRRPAALLGGVDPAPGVRLLGVSVSAAWSRRRPASSRFDDVDGPGVARRQRGRRRHPRAVRRRRHRARVGRSAGSGLRVKRRGDGQWGPGRRPGDRRNAAGN